MSSTQNLGALLKQAAQSESLGEPSDKVLAAYQTAAQAFPDSPEPLYRASRYCRLKGRNEEGFQLAQKALAIAKKDTASAAETGPYDLPILDELSINAYWAGRHQEAARACIQLLASSGLPNSEKARVAQNGEAALLAIQKHRPDSGIDLPERLKTLQRWRDTFKGNADDIAAGFFGFCLYNHHYMTSQHYQDLFVLFHNQRSGTPLYNKYFVEFGAGDGTYLSNTLSLEQKYGWKGILAEPAKAHWKKLQSTRTAICDQRCVWTKSGETVTFVEASDPVLSSMEPFINSDMNAGHRQSGLRYDVETVSLMDLLRQHNAPSIIDYMSIDTEGSELDILSRFDFNEYDVRVITVEHNYTGARNKIFNLLSGHGFNRVLEGFSRADDWYVKLD